MQKSSNPRRGIEVFVGADPEFFLKERSSGQLVSAHGLLPGTKEFPHKIPNGAVQVDGMLAEINIDPASTEEQFIFNLQSVIRQLGEMLPDHELVYSPCETFSPEVWKNTPKEATVLGCMPDYNAWTMEQNPAPDGEVDYRTASGHVHVGWTNGVDINDPGHVRACQILVRELDRQLAMPLAVLHQMNPKEAMRRNLYGRFGAYRPKPYGVEYRTPSNLWLQNEELMRWVYRQVRATFGKLWVGKAQNQQRSAIQDRIESGIAIASDYINGVNRVLYNPLQPLLDYQAKLHQEEINKIMKMHPTSHYVYKKMADKYGLTAGGFSQ